MSAFGVRQTRAVPWKALVCLALLNVAGCATMSENECALADWHSVGYEDGAAGRAATYLGERRKACAEHGITPDTEAWRDGRDAGLEEYCVGGNGYRLGRGNSSYGGVCRDHDESAFLAGFYEGREIGTLEREIASEQRALAKTREEINAVENEIDTLDFDAVLINKKLSLKEKKRILNDIRKLEGRKGELEASLAAISRSIGEAEGRLSILLKQSTWQ